MCVRRPVRRRQRAIALVLGGGEAVVRRQFHPPGILFVTLLGFVGSYPLVRVPVEQHETPLLAAGTSGRVVVVASLGGGGALMWKKQGRWLRAQKSRIVLQLLLFLGQ